MISIQTLIDKIPETDWRFGRYIEPVLNENKEFQGYKWSVTFTPLPLTVSVIAPLVTNLGPASDYWRDELKTQVCKELLAIHKYVEDCK